LLKLNERQFEAATHICGAAIVLSGPGSGKTSVITARALNLVDVHNVLPERLLTVTFSRAAAIEMRQRYIKCVAENDLTVGRVPEYGTLHGFCLKALKQFGFWRDGKKIVSESNGRCEILRQIWNKINSPKGEAVSDEYIEVVSNTISKFRCFSGTEKESMIRREIQIRNFEEIFAEYEAYKKNNGLTDFDDMIFETAVRLSENRAFREKLSGSYDFIQVDEGQDMSGVQIEILKSVGSHGNVFLVADDDQGIYGFRGADVSALNVFEKSFENCKRYFLEQNYRSVKRIVDIASAFIGKNSKRYDKNLFTLNECGEKIELIRASCIEAQARFTAEIALANSAAGLTCGILYRKNLSALMPLLYLYRLSCRSGIKASFSVAGGFVHPDKYEIIKYYMKLIDAEEKRNGILVRSPLEVYRDIEKSGKASEFREMCAVAGRSEKETEYILCFTKSLGLLCNRYEKIKEFFETLKSEHSDGSIFFSTVHSAKGLEYDCVVIIDASEDEFPKKTTGLVNEIEEERRLFYVAITRAKKKLYILSPDKCGKLKCSPGLFFCETARLLKA